jgi:hypothetical protein
MQGCLATITDSEDQLNVKVDQIKQKIIVRTEIKEQCRKIDDRVTYLSENSRTKIELLIKDLLRIIK